MYQIDIKGLENGSFNFFSFSEVESNELEATWYTKRDYAEIRKTVNATVELMKEGHTEPERFGFCYRGLEYKTDSVRRRRHDNMNRAIAAVLEMQERLSLRGTSSCTISQMIARVYIKHTLQCRADAHRMGLWDSKTVQAVSNASFGQRRQDKAPKMPRRTWAKAG